MTNEERAALIEDVRASAEKIEQGRDHLGVAKVYRFLLGELDEVTRQRGEARASLRTWEAWDAEHHGGVRAYVAALEADQRRLVIAEQDAAQARADFDEARSQLAALHAAWDAWCNSGGSRFRMMATHDAFANTAAAAKAHEARTRAPVEAERDTLTMALSEVREAARPALKALGNIWSDAGEALEGAVAALPADLAAQREARDAIGAAFSCDEDVSAQDVIDRLLADEAEVSR